MPAFGQNWKITCGNGRTIPRRWCDLHEVQQRDGAVDQAVKTYEKVVADNPLYAPATRQLALLYGQLSTDSAKAYELVTKARQAYPDDPDIAKTLGILNYRRGYYPQSVELLKQAAAKRKDDPELLYYLGEAHRQLKQYAECKGVLERALTLNLSPGLADDARRALAECSETAPLGNVASAKAAAAIQFGLEEIQRNRIMVQELA